MAIKRAASKELQHRAHIGERFKELFLQTGLGLDGVAQTLHVTPRTVRNWLSGNTAIPYTAYKLLRIQRYFELPGEGWDGWHMHGGKLWSPEGFGFLPHESNWWSLLVRQARSCRTVYDENTRLQREASAASAQPQGQRSAVGPCVGAAPAGEVPVTLHFSPVNRNPAHKAAMVRLNEFRNSPTVNPVSACPAVPRYARVTYSQNLFKGGV
jgi:transcriptional regulator with XRE-family HTH domain